MPRAKLPLEVQELFPDDIIRMIHSYVPYPKKEKRESISPSLQRELHRIQTSNVRNIPAMFLKDFTDFCLD